MYRVLTTILILFISLIYTEPAIAGKSLVAGSSASIKSATEMDYDYRVETLRSFLASHNSPLADKARVFVDEADENKLDWRLVAAISGVESTFGKRIPYESYNAYGWANGKYQFESWEESIAIVNKTLKEKYVDKGAVTVDQIARIYAPPSNTWGVNVKFFMDKIDPVPLSFTI